MKSGLKKIANWIGIFLAVYLIGTILFVGMFHTPIAKSIHVFMYRGVVLLTMSGGILAVLLLLFRYYLYKKLEIKDILLMSLTFCCIQMVLFTLIPVTVERSVSVFMLSYMSEHQDTVFTKEEIEEVFIDKYVEEFGAFEKRFHEQDVTGNIEKVDDGYVITKRGKFMVAAFRLVGKLFDTDRRLLNCK